MMYSQLLIPSFCCIFRSADCGWFNFRLIQFQLYSQDETVSSSWWFTLSLIPPPPLYYHVFKITLISFLFKQWMWVQSRYRVWVVFVFDRIYFINILNFFKIVCTLWIHFMHSTKEWLVLCLEYSVVTGIEPIDIFILFYIFSRKTTLCFFDILKPRSHRWLSGGQIRARTSVRELRNERHGCKVRILGRLLSVRSREDTSHVLR